MKDFLTFLLDKDGRSLVKRNGTVQAVADPVPTKYNPAGLEELAIVWERSLQELCNWRNFSNPFTFYYEDADILRDFLYGRPVSEKLYLLLTQRILKITPTHYRWHHAFLYKGQIDTASLRHDGPGVSAQIKEGGLTAQYKAGKGATREVSLEDGERILVKMDGIFLQEKHNWVIQQAALFGVHTVGTLFTTKEGQATGFASFTIYASNASGVGGENYFFTVVQDITGMRLQGKINLVLMGGTTGYQLNLKTDTGRTIPVLNLSGAQSGTHEIDVTFDAFDGEKFYLQGNATPNSAVNIAFYQESDIAITFKSRYRTTYVPALRTSTAFKRLTSMVTGDSTLAQSALLPNWDRYALTSGDGLRGLPGAVLKTSLEEFREYVRAVLAGDIGVEKGRVVAEAYEHFLRTDNPIHLGRIKNLVPSRAKEIFCNTARIGYKVRTIDDVNGRYSAHNTHLYTFAPVEEVKELSFISPYFACPYAAELLRINYEGKTTTDSDKDGDVFILDTEDEPELNVTAHLVMATGFFDAGILRFPDQTHLDKFVVGMHIALGNTILNNGIYTVGAFGDNGLGGFDVYLQEPLQAEEATEATVRGNIYALRRDPDLTITGVPDPATIFNLSLTPKNIARRQQRWIDSVFYGFAGQALKFSTTEKNRELRVEDAVGTVIDEDADFPIGDNPLFLPLNFDLDTETPVDLVGVMDDDPNRPFSFERGDGRIYTLLNFRCGIAPANYKEQPFKGLAAPGNDFTMLKKYG